LKDTQFIATAKTLMHQENVEGVGTLAEKSRMKIANFANLIRILWSVGKNKISYNGSGIAEGGDYLHNSPSEA
jgi:hypothetical protein